LCGSYLYQPRYGSTNAGDVSSCVTVGKPLQIFVSFIIKFVKPTNTDYRKKQGACPISKKEG